MQHEERATWKKCNIKKAQHGKKCITEKVKHEKNTTEKMCKTKIVQHEQGMQREKNLGKSTKQKLHYS